MGWRQSSRNWLLGDDEFEGFDEVVDLFDAMDSGDVDPQLELDLDDGGNTLNATYDGPGESYEEWEAGGGW